MATKSLLSQVKLNFAAYADSVSKKKDGTIVLRRGYYFRHGKTAEKFAAGVASLLAQSGLPLTVSNFGDHYASFNGGASLANSSHFWVELV
jgi:hypothetical protein